jgi:hypothetical protein
LQAIVGEDSLKASAIDWSLVITSVAADTNSRLSLRQRTRRAHRLIAFLFRSSLGDDLSTEFLSC